MQNGSGSTERVMAFRDQRGQPERGKKEKESSLRTLPHFYSHTSFPSQASAPPFSLSSFIILPVSIWPFYYLFPFLFPSHHSSPPLIFSLTYCIYYGLARGEHTSEMVPPSRKFLQLEDKSLLKRTERIPLTLGCVALCSGTFKRVHVFVLMFTHRRCRFYS